MEEAQVHTVQGGQVSCSGCRVVIDGGGSGTHCTESVGCMWFM